MITPQELRIGNYILLDTGVAMASWHKVMPRDIADMAEGRVTIHSMGGIPLNPRMLEARGFDLRSGNEDGDIYGKGNFTLFHSLYVDNSEDNTVQWSKKRAFWLNGYHNDCQLQYLHQLQNLYFALTGTELEITP